MSYPYSDCLSSDALTVLRDSYNFRLKLFILSLLHLVGVTTVHSVHVILRMEPGNIDSCYRYPHDNTYVIVTIAQNLPGFSASAAKVMKPLLIMQMTTEPFRKIFKAVKCYTNKITLTEEAGSVKVIQKSLA
jgi:hypothetical protein